VAEPHPLRPLRQGTQEDLGGAGVAVLLEEVVLDEPEAVDPDPVGELGLLERLVEHPLLVAVLPGPRHLVLVEDPEAHGRESDRGGRAPARRSAYRWVTP